MFAFLASIFFFFFVLDVRDRQRKSRERRRWKKSKKAVLTLGVAHCAQEQARCGSSSPRQGGPGSSGGGGADEPACEEPPASSRTSRGSPGRLGAHEAGDAGAHGPPGEVGDRCDPLGVRCGRDAAPMHVVSAPACKGVSGSREGGCSGVTAPPRWRHITAAAARGGPSDASTLGCDRGRNGLEGSEGRLSEGHKGKQEQLMADGHCTQRETDTRRRVIQAYVNI